LGSQPVVLFGAVMTCTDPRGCFPVTTPVTHSVDRA
jgi:hypothetical protein